MTDSPPAPDVRPSQATPTQEERARWQAAMALFETLQDLPPEQRDARLRAEPPAPEVLAMLLRMFAAIGETCVLDRPLQAPGQGAADAGEASTDADSVAPALAGRRFGRWLLLQPLGSGGMSTVWRVRSVSPPVGQEAALKLLRLGASDAAGRARFAREIRILAALRHPGIAAIHDAGHTEDGTPWFTMALVEGDTIDAWCERHAADVRTRVALVRQAADAAAHAHRHLVVHRDIKPGNVMVDEAGRVSLLDFGISRLLEDVADQAAGGAPAADGDADATARTYAFTPRYAAPEQLRGGAQTTATDVYGLGALLHQLLLGVPPQWAEGASACREPSALGRATGDARLRSELRGDLGAILRKALEARPEDRYAGAADLADDLAAWCEGRPVHARAGGMGYRLRRWVGRHRLAVGLGTGAVLALALGAGGALWQRSQALEAAQRAETAQRFLLDVFAEADVETRGERAPDLPRLLRAAAQRARADYAGQPAQQAELLHTIGRLQQLNADHAGAVETLGAALALDAARDAPWDERRRRAVIAHAASLRRAGDGKASARAIDDWLAIDPPPMSSQGGEPITGPHCRGVLGATYPDAHARRQAAEAVREDCLRLPPGDADRLFFVARLVENRRADGDGPGALALAEAEDTATAALVTLPPRAWDDWVVLKAALAQAYRQARRAGEAEAAAAAAVALAERNVGGDSPFLIGPLRTHATMLADVGRSADARAALARAIALNAGEDGAPLSRGEAVALRLNLGVSAYADGEYRAAITAWREALTLAGDSTSADVGQLHANLAAAHDALGDYADAAAAAQRALDHFAAHFPAREDARILPGYHLCLAQSSLGDARGLDACAQAMARERAGAPGDTLLRIEGDQYLADALTRLRAWPRALATADGVIAALRARPGHDTGAAADVLTRARFHRIEALTGLGRGAEAAAEFAALGDARCIDEALAERARAALRRSGAGRGAGSGAGSADTECPAPRRPPPPAVVP